MGDKVEPRRDFIIDEREVRKEPGCLIIWRTKIKNKNPYWR